MTTSTPYETAQAIARDTLPPTLLFAGPAGVGKFLTARAVAAALNCQSPVRSAGGLAIDACGKCRSCDRIARDVEGVAKKVPGVSSALAERLTGGRYVDRFERRDGRWRIAERTFVLDWMRTRPCGTTAT